MWLVTTELDSDACGSRAQEWLLEIHEPAVFPESESAASLLGVSPASFTNLSLPFPYCGPSLIS